MCSRFGIAATSGLTAAVLFAIANAFAADSSDAAAVVFCVLSIIAILIAIFALFPRFGSWIGELLFWWV